MAAILQLRQGSTSTYISQGPNIAEPFFDTGSNILVVGKSATEVIKLTKLDESNNGSFSITGDYTGSHLYLSGDLSASNANLSGDITIGGNIILGDQVQDNITVSGQFDSDLIPSESLEYDLGSTTKKWNVLYASRVDATELTGSIQVTNTILPDANEVYDLGSPTQRFRDFYISSGSLRLGGHTISSPDNGNTVRFSGPRVQIGGLTGGRIEYNPTRNFLNLKGPSTDTSIPVVSSRVYLTGSNGEGYLEMGGDSNTMRFSQRAFQLGGNSGNRIAYNSTRNAIQFQGPTTEEVTPIISSKVILSGSNGEINLEVGADGNLSSSNSDGSQTQGTYSGSFSGDGSELTFGGTGIVSGSEQLPSGIVSGSEQFPSGVISGSTQLTLLGYDGYFGWSANADNSNSIYISSGRTLYFEGGDGITTEARNSGNYYITIDLDTGSAHFTDAVAGVGAPAGTVSGSSQILDGSDILSSSLQTNGFDDYSNSVDIRLQSLETESHSHSNKIQLDTVDQNLAQTSSPTFNNINITGTASFDSDLTIYGDLTVFGTESIVNAENLSIADNMLYLNSGSSITNPDLGFAGNYNDGTYAHAGLFRDASDNGVWKFFDSYVPEPEGSIDTTHGTFNYAGLHVGFIEVNDVVSSENFIGTGSQLVFPGTNIVSSSQQVVDFLPSGLVSGSSQVITILNNNTVISGSSQLENIFFSQLYAPEIIGTDVTDVWNPALNRLATTYAIQKFISDEGVISGSSQISLLDPFTQLDPSYVLLSTETYVEADNRLASTLAISKELNSKGLVSGSSQIQSLLPSGTVSSSVQIIEILETQTPGLVSGSDQVTQSLDLRYATLGGSGLLSSSNENFSDFSQSVDLRLENTLDSGSATSQSLYLLTGNFPTSGSLGTAAFYNVSSSLADDPNVIPNVKAVYDYINNVVQAADITGVSASLGLFGGGDGGYVSLSLDTASAHFQEGVELYSSILPSGVISSSAQITDLGFLVTSSALYNDQNNLAVGTNSPTNLGATQFTINDSNNAGTSGLISFTDSDVVKSYDYVTNNYRYVDTNTGVGIVLKPDADATKSWIIDTDGDLVSNGGGWASGNIYANNLIASSSVTASYILVDEDITANNFIGNIQATNGVVSGSQQVIDSLPSGVVSGSKQITDFGFISESNSLYNDQNNLAIGTNTPTNLGATQFTINDSNNSGQSGLISFTDSDVVKSYDYVNSNYRYIDTNIGVGIVLKPDSDSNKSWIVDTDGDLVSNGGSWSSGNAYMNNLIASSSVTASNMLVDNDITANNFIGNIQATNGIISGSDQLTGSFVDLTSTQTIGGTKTFNDIVVNGTGSFAYIESVEGSAKIIGDAYIILNNDTPTERYAGIAVYDSGSVGVTASLEFDGQTNDWFYEYSDDGGVTTDHGVVLFGPEYSTKGSPTYPSNNTIQKGNGGHHLLDSNITDDGSTITLNSDTTVNGVLSATTFDSLVSQSLLNDLTNDEVNQLKNIDSVTISNTQWGYLGGMDQGVAAGDSVNFDELTIDSTTNSTSKTTGALTVAGGVGIAKTLNVGEDIVAYASSDRRLKEEITPISNPIEKISQIGGYSFVWNSEKQNIYKGKDYGVIAQEIEEILPELVDTRENGYKAVKYDRLVSLLIEGIKELSSEVKELKEKINRE